MQGKRPDQIEASERLAIITITALIGTIMAIAFVNLIL
jgi:hypothetical protein